jgi:hypothetical protein
MQNFLEALKTQRWDDHRYYHHSRINQSLHLVSALSFLAAYFTIFTSPVASALIGWLGAMVSRQVGHFFFEPKGYDAVNEATHEHKEDIKVGYNLKRKIILLSLWALSPLLLWLDPNAARSVFATGRRRAIPAACRPAVAGSGPGRTAVSHGAAVLSAGCADRSGMAHQDHHRSVSRHHALLPRPTVSAAR